MTGRKFRYFAIFGAMRTGSNLLERTISQYDGIECFGELFNPAFIGGPNRNDFDDVSLSEREANPTALIDRMVARSPDALTGFRIFQNHDPRVIRHCLSDPECGKIILRRNPLDSYVSLEIARKTDQWMLGNAKARKTARITFRPEAYKQYLEDLSQYHADMNRALQEAGETAFGVRYEDLKTPDIVNGIARFLGSNDSRQNFAEPIKRQNPEPLREKVINYDEMIMFVGSNSDAADGGAPASQRRMSVRDYVVCRRLPVAYLPLPGVDPHLPLASMANADGCDAGDLATGLNQREFSDWLDGATGLTAFSVVDHPLARAYRVYMQHIFPTATHGFPQIRARLVANFGLTLPEGNQEWSAEDHATSFETFLEFLKANVAGQTSIRIDPSWEAQHLLLEAAQPLTRVIRAQDYMREAAVIFGAAPDKSGVAVHEPDLSQIHTRRMENLARAAYAKDYRLYGFSEWRPEAAR